MKFKQLPKKMWMALAVFLCSVVSTQAANITYSLTTHVDGRLMTEIASVSEGASLESNMPQALWRAYTTYKYYSDAELTKEITEAPAEDATVYVDYVFDPPFIMSQEGSDPIWNYLRSYNAGGTDNYIVYYKQEAENNWGTYKQTIMGWKSTNGSTPPVGRNNPLTKAGHDQWAFYGDAYDFQIRLNDPEIANNYMIWRSTSRAETPMGLGAKPEVGWQLYTNTATNNKLSSGTVAMGPYNATNYLASLENLSSDIETDGLDTSRQFFDSHNQLVHKTGTSSSGSYQRNLWWYAFFASPVSSSPSTTDIWHVTYKIQKTDGSWYPDVVVQKSSSNLKPSFPPAGFTMAEDCTYDYFYLDADFTEKCAEDYSMPKTENTVLYIKEVAVITIDRELTKDRWITLVLPYDVDDVNNIDGIKGEALEYYQVKVGGKANSSEVTLNFRTVTEMKANKPYLFRAVEFPDGANYGTLKVYEGPESGKPVETDLIAVNYDDNQVNVKMVGTYEGKTLDVAPKTESAGYEYIYFYFGYDSSAETPYNFYVVDNGTVKINPYLCYFEITSLDDANSNVSPILSMSFNDATGINQVKTVAEDNADKVYNLNGQRVSGNLSKGVYIVNGKKYLVK